MKSGAILGAGYRVVDEDEVVLLFEQSRVALGRRYFDLRPGPN